nr:MAG: internal scaffolding protein [Microvirus sp.]
MSKSNDIPFQTPFGSHRSVDLICLDESLTLQSCKDECDINNILDRWQSTGILEHARQDDGFFGDFLDVHDYQSSLEAVRNADNMFNSLPSSVREFFDNNPAKLLEFVNDESNRDKAVELGLIDPIVSLDTTPAPQETGSSNDA